MEPFGIEKPIIGVIHLLPLPGSPKGQSFDSVLKRAVSEALILEEGGVDGLIIENFGDAPYVKDNASPETIAFMTAIAKEISMSVSLPLGINILRNCVDSAIAVAAATGGKFVRANVWVGVYITDQGVIEGKAHNILRFRKALGADHIKIFADVRVKHAHPIVPISIEDEVKDNIERGLADALIVTGPRTGQPPSSDYVSNVKKVAGEVPVLIGSGLNLNNTKELLTIADGAIVGTFFKVDGIITNPIDIKRVRSLISLVKELRKIKQK
ncbi:MAG: BtpA/SgcQ family protein [Thermoprotei archaeon]|jgi:membrane complex biogenesis BtpA family protein